MDFLEKISAKLFDKQMIFKQDNGSYYSKYHSDYLTKEDIEEWLLEYIN